MDQCLLCKQNNIPYPPHKYGILCIFCLRKKFPIEIIRLIAEYLIHKKCYYLKLSLPKYPGLTSLGETDYKYLDILIKSSPIIDIGLQQVDNFCIKYYTTLKIHSYNENTIPKNIDKRVIKEILSIDF